MQHETSRRPSRMSAEERGVAVAILVAFAGVALGGPTLRRLEERRRHLARRIADGADEVHERSRRYAEMGRRRLRRLGGGAVWR